MISMIRPISIIGAPSSIGIRPYDDGTPRRLDLAPAALRKQDLTARIGAHDFGDVVSAPYRDFVRTPGQARNEPEVAAYSRALASHIAAVPNQEAFLLLLGGDCSIVLGALLGLRLRGHSRVGLIYVDAHADFATPESSRWLGRQHVPRARSRTWRYSLGPTRWRITAGSRCGRCHHRPS
jgi:arginase